MNNENWSHVIKYFQAQKVYYWSFQTKSQNGMFSKGSCGCNCLRLWPQSSTEDINAYANGKQETTKTLRLLWGSLLLCSSTSEQKTWTNKELKSRSLMCWKADNSTAISSKLWGSPRNIGNFSSVCALLLKLCWDQRLRKALIRGRAMSQVFYEPGPPVWALSADPLRNCTTGFKRDRIWQKVFRVSTKCK